VPLWAASGSGAISRQVLGTTVIGGMIAASLIAIFFVPVLFFVVERLAHGGLKHKAATEPVAEPLAVDKAGAH
jgi:HAE1 family hydrophobic/amphiphilic exporter-1